ncbi:MAG: ribbon-helix-helix protein, CopG family [Thermoleophilia bacterium]|nr:ribbon-helix-helix protein, CopG family [Thermoleophilia bacterium]
MATKYRAQILLERDQQRALAQLAEEQGRSVSDLVRQAVQEFLHDETQIARRRRREAALQSLSRLQEQIRSRHGVLGVDLVREAREEREVQLDHVWGVGE